MTNIEYTTARRDMTINIQIEKNCGHHIEPILRALPEWFGIEESLIQYVKDADLMPTMIVRDDDAVVGFLTINHHFPESAEIHCMGILPKYHRTGTGKALLVELESHLKELGVKFLQVKTISEDKENQAYAKSRAFYKALGFISLEMFPTLWDHGNPCLLLVKSIA